MIDQEIEQFLHSILSRHEDARRKIEDADQDKLMNDEVFEQLLKKADSAVDDMASWVEENY